eukprot:5363199-Heterocapsa_arctica.AAC.1
MIEELMTRISAQAEEPPPGQGGSIACWASGAPVEVSLGSKLAKPNPFCVLVSILGDIDRLR